MPPTPSIPDKIMPEIKLSLTLHEQNLEILPVFKIQVGLRKF
jgi:hypothetical protein